MLRFVLMFVILCVLLLFGVFVCLFVLYCVTCFLCGWLCLCVLSADYICVSLCFVYDLRCEMLCDLCRCVCLCLCVNALVV